MTAQETFTLDVAGDFAVHGPAARAMERHRSVERPTPLAGAGRGGR